MSATPSVLRIDGELTIYRARELMQPIVEATACAFPAELDLAGVTEIDTAGVQLLLLAARSARAAGGEMRITAHSDVVRKALGLLGLGPSLGCSCPVGNGSAGEAAAAKPEVAR